MHETTLCYEVLPISPAAIQKNKNNDIYRWYMLKVHQIPNTAIPLKIPHAHEIELKFAKAQDATDQSTTIEA